jgi:AraC-like DNA-binding protein
MDPGSEAGMTILRPPQLAFGIHQNRIRPGLLSNSLDHAKLSAMKLLIKNMVCDRCKMAIEAVLAELDLVPASVQLGEVDLGELTLETEQLELFREKIEALGFELINDRKSRQIEAIKKAVIELVQQPEAPEKLKLSAYLSARLHHDYSHLSNLFSTVEGVTIEQYFINQKIEKTRELLVYDELTLTEIADRLGYSSVAHLSRQFKKITGMTPSQFKQLRDGRQRRSLDKV